MEAVLRERQKKPSKWEKFKEELKKVWKIAMPMLVVTLSQNLLRTATKMMIGHLDKLSLSGAAIAFSITNATGFSLISGMASALETLCGQAYGAEQYQKLTTYTYAAAISLLLVCIPVSLMWIFVEKLLILINQDPLIAAEAGKFSIWLIPSLFSYAILKLLVRFLQTQSLILPMLLSSVLSLCIHMPLCWALVFKLKLGNSGAALAIGLSYWVNVIMLVLYVKYSFACEKTRVSFSLRDVSKSMREFFQLAFSSTVMVCLEYWMFEIIILISGLLPNPQLETSVLSICLTVDSLHNNIPLAISVAASTRISNELGAGNPKAAQGSVLVVLVLALGEVLISGITLLCCQSFLGYAFGNDKEIVEYVKEMMPLLCLSLIMDNISAVLGGVARGSGWQRKGVYVNLGAYYLAGIPLAVILGFVVHLKGKGLWIGLLTGSACQAILLSLITFFTDWKKQAEDARERIFSEEIPERINLSE